MCVTLSSPFASSLCLFAYSSLPALPRHAVPLPYLAPLQESQLALLRLADKHQQPLPFQNNDYRQRLQLGAAQKQLEAAEAQLAGLPAGCGAAAGLADAGAGGAAPAAAAAALAGVVAAAGGQAE